MRAIDNHQLPALGISGIIPPILHEAFNIPRRRGSLSRHRGVGINRCVGGIIIYQGIIIVGRRYGIDSVIGIRNRKHAQLRSHPAGPKNRGCRDPTPGHRCRINDVARRDRSQLRRKIEPHVIEQLASGKIRIDAVKARPQRCRLHSIQLHIIEIRRRTPSWGDIHLGAAPRRPKSKGLIRKLWWVAWRESTLNGRAIRVDQGQILTSRRQLEVGMQLPGRKCPVFVRSKYHQSRPGIQIHPWKSPLGKIPDIISQMIPSQRNRGGVWVSDLNPITKISVFIRQNRIIDRHKFRNNGARQSAGNREYCDVGKQILKINQ